MTAYYNKDRVDDGKLLKSLGEPTLADGDEIYLLESNDTYDDATDLNLASIDFLTIHMLPGWTGNMGNPDGSGAGALICEANRTATGRIMCHWGGRFIGLQGGGGKVLNYIEVRAQRGDARVLLRDWTTVSQALVERGHLSVLGDVDVDTLRVNGGSARLYKSANVTATVEVAAGELVIEREVQTLDCIGGVTIKREDAYALGGSGSVKVRNGATLRVEGIASLSTSLEVYAGGTLDLRALTRPLNLGSTTVRMHAGSLYIPPANQALVTLPSTWRVGSGPTVQPS